jgi:hypothetical protein
MSFSIALASQNPTAIVHQQYKLSPPESVSTVVILPFISISSSCAAMRLLPVALLLWVVTCYNVAASALGPMRTFLTTFTIPPDVQPEQELVRSSRCCLVHSLYAAEPGTCCYWCRSPSLWTLQAKNGDFCCTLEVMALQLQQGMLVHICSCAALWKTATYL